MARTVVADVVTAILMNLRRIAGAVQRVILADGNNTSRAAGHGGHAALIVVVTRANRPAVSLVTGRHRAR
jgi:hypothetical protein